VAALLLGAQSVLAVDIDVQALQATGDNLARNKISSDKLSAYLPEQAPAHQSDILVANILSGPLIELAPALAERTLPGGLLALSGILEEQTHDIVDTYTQWFELDPVVTLDGWIRVTGRRR
ncbi:MAG: 50S ribosomal protein L11 methyltransferase, partial [Pseudomonadales bacterium]